VSVGVLDGLRVIEGSAFVAAPLGGMTLAQNGADVIRFDQVGGGLDFNRWPLAVDGQSLFWAGLNKGKRSIAVDLRSDEGRELAVALIAETGVFLTNFSIRGWLDFEALRARREDVIVVALTGNHDGTGELDYTVNPATGFPWITGPREHADPVNHVLPAWDIALGTLAAFGILAAERHRSITGAGQLVRLALSDVAFSMVGNLGRLAQARLDAEEQVKDGNYLYGAFGHDFETRDGRRVMVTALTDRQWIALRDVTQLAAGLDELERSSGHDLGTQTGRFSAREAIAVLLRPWFASRDLSAVRELFEGTGVSWGPYQTFRQLVEEDPRCSPANTLFEEVEHPGVGRYAMPGSPLWFDAVDRAPVRRSPILGEHTDEILADLLGLSATEIGRLHDAGTVAGPPAAL
jgi:2-methylfumaryl-CoA isomerase